MLSRSLLFGTAVAIAFSAPAPLVDRLGVPDGLIGLSDAAAQSSAEKREEEKERRGRARKGFLIQNEKLAKALNEAVAFLETEQYNEALAVLDEKTPRLDRLSSYERAKFYQVKGQLLASKSDYKQAITFFDLMLKEEDLPESDRSQSTYTLAQLYLAEEQPAKTVELMNQWFRTAENAAPNAYFLLATAYLQQEQYANAIQPALDTVEAAKVRQQTVREQWYRALVVTHQQTEDYVTAARWLRELLIAYPKRLYWLQFSSFQSRLGNEKEELAVYRAAYRQGLFQNSNEYVRLAQLLSYHGAPYEASRLMQKELDAGNIEVKRTNLEFLAGAYTQAREFSKAVDPFAKAADMANEGKLYERLGQVYLEEREWTKAADAFKKALDTGKARSPYRTTILRGLALTNANQFSAATRVFEQAARLAKTQGEKRGVKGWLRFVQDEKRTYDSIKEFRLTRYEQQKARK
ncbi:MAG: CDC27 family protein [Pseudomonadota bacterium]